MDQTPNDIDKTKEEITGLIAKWESFKKGFRQSPILYTVFGLFSLASSGGLTWVMTTWEVAVHDAVIEGVRDEGSDIHMVIMDEAEKEAKAIVDHHVDSLVTIRIQEALSNPLLWEQVLNSVFLTDFVDKKASEIEEGVDAELAKRDSSKSFVEYIGEELQMRDEDVLPLFSKMMKAFKDGKIVTTRRVEVNI